MCISFLTLNIFTLGNDSRGFTMSETTSNIMNDLLNLEIESKVSISDGADVDEKVSLDNERLQMPKRNVLDEIYTGLAEIRSGSMRLTLGSLKFALGSLRLILGSLSYVERSLDYVQMPIYSAHF